MIHFRPFLADGNFLDQHLVALIVGLLLLVAMGIGTWVFARLKPRPPRLAGTAGGDGETRSTIARNVAIFAIVGVVALSATVLATGKDLDTAKFVFGAVLPLLGTWVGTILAYYFARENLAAATQSVSAFADRIAPPGDDSVSVQKRMRKPADIKRKGVADGQDEQCKLTELLELGVDRILVVDTGTKEDVIRYLIYKSVIDAYRAGGAFPTGKTADTVTLKDLVDKDGNKTLFETSWAVVDSHATIGDARRRMAAQGEKCNDVFVTDGASSKGKLQGWLTDNRLSPTYAG